MQPPGKESATPAPTAREPTWAEAMLYPRACVGAMIGAAIGVMVVNIAAGAGFYAMIVVGILTGFGATLAARRGGWRIALIAALISLAASLWAEWWIYPFLADGSLGYFITHLGDLKPFSLLIHAAGALVAGYIAFRR